MPIRTRIAQLLSLRPAGIIGVLGRALRWVIKEPLMRSLACLVLMYCTLHWFGDAIHSHIGIPGVLVVVGAFGFWVGGAMNLNTAMEQQKDKKKQEEAAVLQERIAAAVAASHAAAPTPSSVPIITVAPVAVSTSGEGSVYTNLQDIPRARPAPLMSSRSVD